MKIKYLGDEVRPLPKPYEGSPTFYQFEVDEPMIMPLLDEVLRSLIRLIKTKLPSEEGILIISQLKGAGKRFTKLEAFWSSKSTDLGYVLLNEVPYDSQTQIAIWMFNRLDESGGNKTWSKVVELSDVEE